jgi:hypothetical protein
VRTYGRINQVNGRGGQWVEVTTDAQGFNDAVWATTLCQVLKLNLQESPFYGDWGIPAESAVIQQVFPDYYATLTQQRFAQYFASLIISKQRAPYPAYLINIVTNQGEKLSGVVPQ